MRKGILAPLVQFAALLLLWTGCSSDNTPGFQVKVVDQIGQPVEGVRVILSDSEGRLLQEKSTNQLGIVDFGEMEIDHATVSLVQGNHVRTLMHIPATRITVPVSIDRPLVVWKLDVEMTELSADTAFTQIVPFILYDFEESDTTKGIFKNLEVRPHHLQPDGKLSLLGITTLRDLHYGYGYSLDQDPAQINNNLLQIPIKFMATEIKVSTVEPVDLRIRTYRKTIVFDPMAFGISILNEPLPIYAFPIPDQDFFVLYRESFETDGSPFKFKRVETKYIALPEEMTVSMPNVRVASATLEGEQVNWSIEGDSDLVDGIGGLAIKGQCIDHQRYSWSIYFDPKGGALVLPQLPPDLASRFGPPFNPIEYFYVRGFDRDLDYDTAVLNRLYWGYFISEAGVNDWITVGFGNPPGRSC